MKRYVAIDIMPEAVRTFIGTPTEHGIDMELIDSFPNRQISLFGHVYWNMYVIYVGVIDSLRKIAQRGVEIQSIGIDGFGADICCFGSDGQLLSQPLSFLDIIEDKRQAKIFNRMSEDELYGLTGMPNLSFSSIMLLDAMRCYGSTALSVADKLLFMQDALAYMLTGEMTTGSIVASAGSLLNITTRSLDSEILSRVGLNAKNLGSFVEAGMSVGFLNHDVQSWTGLGSIPVVSVAGHNVISAAMSVPSCTPNQAYIFASKTSAVGMEVDSPQLTMSAMKAKLCNQHSIGGYICLHRFVNGLGVLDRLRKEWDSNISDEELFKLAAAADENQSVIDTDTFEFSQTNTTITQVIKQICNYTRQPQPQSFGDYVRCLIISVATKYAETLSVVSYEAKLDFDEIHMTGKTSDNPLLCQSLADISGKTVIGGQEFAAARGNIMIQAIASGEATCIDDLKTVERNNKNLVWYKPH